MGFGDIIGGHFNEALGINSALSESRLKICRKCPLYKMTTVGPMCNSNMWINLKTGDVSETIKDGYVNGCGCRLEAKTTLVNARCPINKW